MTYYQLNKFIEDTQTLMGQPIGATNNMTENELIPGLPQDFTLKHGSSSVGSQTFLYEEQASSKFDTPNTSISEVDDSITEDQSDKTGNQSVLTKITSAFNGIGGAITNGTKSLCCSSICKEKESPVYDLANLPSGLDSFFDEKAIVDNVQSSERETRTVISKMTSDTFTGVREMFQTPRFSNESSCFNPFASCKLNITKLMPKNEVDLPKSGLNNSNNGAKMPSVTYKLHAIEIHQPINNCESKGVNNLSVTMGNYGTIFQKGLENFDPERTGIPALTMAQIIQQHKTFLKKR
ncbi:hypothetical protein BmR1_04g07240 [Babesia microti strain RI]|uniref:Uncharacterized protein n=1 Tax=Babesia microti (strain RI) TaxID=1133968 RepID=I7IHD9_BABMR|nr:hypothetical protein BmR1_04g07240 [Babesia microti strain RI]CCF75642.1 hypothetical protein BmR1_04g07240 [Babesia microti strain RI]|eukprot:XP_012650050.1 hypothetical protein BmR1_04g07240 [Babesia microti strain RI]